MRGAQLILSPARVSECHRRKDRADCPGKGGLRQERFRTWVWNCPCQSLLGRMSYLTGIAGGGPFSNLPGAHRDRERGAGLGLAKARPEACSLAWSPAGVSAWHGQKCALIGAKGGGGQANRCLGTAPGGWGGRIRTFEWRLQRPLPYHLATPQKSLAVGDRQQASRRLVAFPRRAQSTGFGLGRQTPRNSLLRIYFISARLTSFRTSR